MLFISCKQIEEDRFIETDSPCNQVYFCSFLNDGKETMIKDIGSLNFMKSVQQNNYKQVMFYLHGFNNQPEDVFYQTELLQQLCDIYKQKECLVIPIIWPCHNQVGILRGLLG